MTTRTITFDDEQWQLVPREPTQGMCVEMQTSLRQWPRSPFRVVPMYAAMLAAAPEPKTCFCDARGIGDPAKSCGDCPQDYGIPTVRANPEPPAQQPTEPAAYMYQHDETGRTTFREADDRMNERRWEEFPLYRHPAPAQQPMTEEEIASISETQVGTAHFLVAKLHVREAERHHGIAKGESNAD